MLTHKQALELIEYLSDVCADNFKFSLKNLKKNLDDINKIAHSCLNTSCHNAHQDWRDEAEEMYYGIKLKVDLEKIKYN